MALSLTSNLLTSSFLQSIHNDGDFNQPRNCTRDRVQEHHFCFESIVVALCSLSDIILGLGCRVSDPGARV